MVHIAAAFVAFFVCWIEAVCLWCPSRLFHVAYGTIVFGFFVVGVLQIEGLLEVVEWSILGAHLIAVWFNYTRVAEEIKNGTWRPWVGCCHCCCPGLAVADGGNCCPPVGDAICCRYTATSAKGDVEANSEPSNM